MRKLAYVYRYIDNSDGVIKYVGIVWSENRTLTQRIYEHQRNDEWCKNGSFTIEYIEENINTRTDAEYFESHYISLYGTDKYFNEKKSGWGVSSFLPDRENDWKKYDKSIFKNIGSGDYIYKITWTENEDIDVMQLPVIRKICKRKIKTDYAHCRCCGSNNLYRKDTNTHVGQIYCSDCGEWACQSNGDFKIYYTPEYNGEYKYNGEEIEEYEYFTILYGKKYPQTERNKLSEVYDGYSSLALNMKKNLTYIYTYATSEYEIEEAKARLVKHIMNKKKQEIDKKKERLIEIEKEKKELPNVIKSLKLDFELFNSRFSDLLVNY